MDDNSEKETVNHEGFMPWAYDTPKKPKNPKNFARFSQVY